MKKVLIVLWLLIISIAFSSCGIKTNTKVNEEIDINKVVSLKEKQFPVGFDPYKKKVLLAIYDENNKISLGFYDIKSTETEIVVKPVDYSKNIGSAVTDGKCIGWVEASDNQGMWGDDWRIYVKDLKTEDVKMIAESKFVEGKISGSKFSVEPRLSLNGNRLVWSTYESDGENKSSSVFLYDLKENKQKIIQTLKGKDNYHFSDPHIFENYIVWSESRIDRQKEIGGVYLYSIAENRILKLSDRGTSSNIWGDNVAWVEGNKKVMLYNIKSKKKIEIPTYSGEVWAVSLNREYVTWYNTNRNIKLYNIKTARTQIINIPIINGPVIYGDIMTWVREKSDKTVPQFILLSE